MKIRSFVPLRHAYYCGRDARGSKTLREIVTQCPEEVSRLAAIRFLGEAKDTASVRPLLERLKTGTPVEREAAATALGLIGDRTAADALHARLKDNYPRVRIAAVTALKTLTGQDYSKIAAQW
jgi:HEAT repeat protein